MSRPRAALVACACAVLVSGLLLSAPKLAAPPSQNAAAAIALSDPALSDPALSDSALTNPNSAAHSDTNDPDSDDPEPPMISNDEIVVAQLQPSGLPDEVTLVSRLVTVDAPAQMVADPASVTNVRYLDRLGRPQISGSDVLLPAGGEGKRSVLTEARFDKPLPVALHAQYTLDDKVVSPDAVAGATGDLRIDYTLTNTTAEEQELTYTDAAGSRHTSKRPVFAPFSGTVTVTIPATLEVSSAPGAIPYADAAGNTVLTWNVSLFPPVSPNQQTLVVHATAQRAAIPAVTVRLVPVTSRRDPALDFTAGALDASVTGNVELHQGLVELDDNAATLAEGAGQLAGGLQNLASGTGRLWGAADQLSNGLAELTSGADQVAAGTGQLATALSSAASGARQLAAVTEQLAKSDTLAASEALTSLIGGARELTAGAAELATRFGSAADPPLPNPLPAPDSDTRCEPRRVSATASPSPSSPSPSSPSPSSPGPSSPRQTDQFTSGNPDAARTSATATNSQTGPAQSTPAASAPLTSETAIPAATTLPPATVTGPATSPATATSPASPPPYDDDCVTLYQGVRALVLSLSEIASLSQMINTEIASANTAAAAIRSGLVGIGNDTATAATGSAALMSQLCGPVPTLPPATCTGLAAVAAAAGRAAQGTVAMADPLAALLTSLGKLSAYGTILSQATTASVKAGNSLLVGMDAIAAGLGSGTGTGTGQPGLVAGLSGLTAGLVQFSDALSRSSAQLSSALGQVATGTDQLAKGVSQSADGATDLAAGSQTLAQGTSRAHRGAGLLSAGIQELASGADQSAAGAAELAAGAAQLQTKGTAAVANSVLTASTGPALAKAWLAAAGTRAADALPYGAPAGARGHVAYLMSIPGADPPAPSLWDRITGWFSG